jgi:hypothetical protein
MINEIIIDAPQPRCPDGRWIFIVCSSTQGHLQHVPRSLNLRCRNSEELVRPPADDLAQFHFQAAEELWTTSEIVFQGEQPENIARTETSRPGDFSGRNPKKPHNSP